MPEINGVSCSIHTPDGPLEEYLCVAGPSPNTASAYILARDGQQFSIKCNVPFPYQHMPGLTDGLTFHLEIDGVMERPPMLLDHNKSSINIQGTLVNTGLGGWEIRKFMFSSVELTEEKGHNELTLEKVDKIGEIKVFVCRYKKLGGYGVNVGGHDEGTKRAVIHEKAIKGRDISHSVQRAKGEYCPPVPIVTGMYLDLTARPYMTFRFYYKSERALKNMGLIERSPSPPPHLRIERDPSPARSRPVKNENGRVKRERESSVGPSRRKKVARRQVVCLDEIETIDLTGDD